MIDRETHIEVVIGRSALCGPGFVDAVAAALARFGEKPLLVVCDGPAESPAFFQAYHNGMRLASIARARIAIALGGREPTEAERLTELVAGNRGKDVRAFRDLGSAKTWLAAE